MIDTKNILFICGGAFEGLDKQIVARQDNSTIGFEGTVRTKEEQKKADMLSQVVPHDIVKFGLIPELVGRIPVIVPLQELDEDALVRILKEPKNSIVNQYKELFRMDGVTLEFEENALRAVAKQAIERNTGARGLRAILENGMTDLMYRIPSEKNIESVTITEDFIGGKKDSAVIKEKV